MRFYESSKDINLKFTSTLLALVVVGGSFALIRSCSKPENDAAIIISNEEKNSDRKKEFKPYEHIISTSIELDKGKISQIPYHDGYRLQGITIDSNGKTAVYVNTKNVWCISNGKDKDNNDVYNEFGISEDFKTSKDYYETYEHVLAVPISDPSDKNIQYEYHEGYEVIDIAAYVFGRYQAYGNGYIIYSNNVPVKCERDENDKCLDFGTPITTEKVKTLR